MPRHLTEMRSYMRVAEGMFDHDDPAPVESAPVIVVPEEEETSALMQELQDLQFRLESYTELNEDQQYALGVEQGYTRAADMLGRVLDKYASRSR